MIVYHEVSPDSLDSIRQKGLKCTSRGEKGDDSSIARTDKLLDASRPDYLKQVAVSRDDNLYAYVADGSKLIDIKDGKSVELEDFIKKSEQTVLRLSIDPKRCYVSDLDAFDQLKDGIENDEDPDKLKRLINRYWQKLIPLEQFNIGGIRRPEVMITYDIEPGAIEILT